MGPYTKDTFHSGMACKRALLHSLYIYTKSFICKGRKRMAFVLWAPCILQIWDFSSSLANDRFKPRLVLHTERWDNMENERQSFCHPSCFRFESSCMSVCTFSILRNPQITKLLCHPILVSAHTFVALWHWRCSTSGAQTFSQEMCRQNNEDEKDGHTVKQGNEGGWRVKTLVINCFNQLVLQALQPRLARKTGRQQNSEGRTKWTDGWGKGRVGALDE